MRSYIVNIPDHKTALFEMFMDEISAPFIAAGEMATPTELQLSDLCTKAAELFEVTPAEILSKTRRRPVWLARSAAMCVACEKTTLSLKAIGLYFGGRDHSTVIHARDEAHNYEVQNMDYRARLGNMRRFADSLIDQANGHEDAR